MNKTNEMIFSKNKYGNSRDKMFQAIAQQLALLMENDYVCKVYDDDRDIIVIQYEHDEEKEYWGGMNLCWLTEEEVNLVDQSREFNDMENKDEEM